MTIREEETDLDVEICDLSWQHIVARYWVQSENREIYSVILVFRGLNCQAKGSAWEQKDVFQVFRFRYLDILYEHV